ncbi:MAG: DinB family protein [Bryobacterales bacterium]|nr:DinB family protein [Bryobacterales bacterium]
MVPWGQSTATLLTCTRGHRGPGPLEEHEEPVPLPITDVFDLHSIPPKDIRSAVEEYLRLAHERQFTALRIIHGRGIGVQRETVRSVLSRTPFVHSYQDAPAEAGGWGATIVTLRDALHQDPAQPATRPATVGQMEDLMAQFDAIWNEARQLALSLSAEDFNRQPQPGRWSAGQCLDHLVHVDRMYGERLAEAVSKGKSEGRFAEGPFHYGWLESYVLRSTEPPAKFRVKAPQVFVPSPRHDPEKTLEEFRLANRDLVRLADSAKGLDLRRIKVVSPVTRLWRWSLGIAFAVCAAHERRHLYQARQAAQPLEKPVPS